MTYEIKLPWVKLCNYRFYSKNKGGWGGPIFHSGHKEDASDRMALENGRFVPESQAIALYRGAEMILELDDCLGILSLNGGPKTPPNALEALEKAIELLRKGVGG